MTVPMLRILPPPWDFKMSAYNRVVEDKYEPLRKLSMVQVQPPRNPNKPFTSFGINDILNENGRTKTTQRTTNERSNNNANSRRHNETLSKVERSPVNRVHSSCTSRNVNAHNARNLHIHGLSRSHPVRHNVPVSTRIVRPWDKSPSPERNSEASSDAEEEINVDDDDDDDDDQPASGNLKDVSPLDALMEMANKTFQGLETSEAADAKRREQAALFGKHSTPKKRRKSRTAFTNQQIYELEKRFLYQKYLTPADRDEIAQHLGLTNAQVITWFQNRRAKLKRDLEELKNDVVATKQLSVTSGTSDHEFEIDSDSDAGMKPHTPSKRCRSESQSPVPDMGQTCLSQSGESFVDDKCESPGEIIVDNDPVMEKDSSS